MQDSGTTASLRGIDSVDGTVAWASGSGGAVLKTTDGGAHWTACAVPDAAAGGATLDFRGVQAWDLDTAIVMASGPGDKSRLYQTTDGCKTWTLLLKNPDAPKGSFDSFQVFSKSFRNELPFGYGLLLGDPVIGRFALFEINLSPYSWARVNSKDLFVPEKGASAFAASNSCLMDLYKGTYGFIAAGASASYLVRVPYGEGTWKAEKQSPNVIAPTVKLPLATGAEGSGAFAIAQHLWSADAESPPRISVVVVGGDNAKPNDSAGTAAWSADGGEHWTASAIPPHGFRSSVQWSETLRAWIAAGTNGSDVSRDDGKTWQPLDDGNWNALSLPFVVGPNGRIARLNPAAVPAGK
jgi:photosystem II stability/assembly factor-like uncharacterized protein